MSDSRKPINIKLEDNRVYPLIREENRAYLGETCVRGCRGYARWDEPRYWEAVRKFVADAKEDPKRSRVFVLRKDGYSHDTDDDFLAVKFNAQNFEICTGNLVGSVVRSGESAGDAVGTVTIGSRFGDAFLRYIISDADGFLAIADGGGEEAKSGGYDWLLGYLWNVKFRSAYRLGMPKSYTSRHETLTSPRGQIDVLGFYEYPKRGRVDCNFRELSYDNPAASLFVTTWKVLNSKAATHEFCKSTVNICQAFQQATSGNLRKCKELLDVKHFTNAYYGEYNDLIDLSKVVLKHWGSDFSSTNRSDAILFDVSMLFEYYLRKLLRRNHFNMVPKEVKYLTIPVGAYMRKLIPDIVFRIGDGVGVFDVKYKRYEFSEGVKREDVFQLHTYIGQYGNHQPVKVCGFLYPITEDCWRKHRNGADVEKVVLDYPMRQQGKDLIFCVGFLVVPNVGYGQLMLPSFGEAIKPWVERLISQLKILIEKANGAKNNRGGA